jgi:hypothetical protein
MSLSLPSVFPLSFHFLSVPAADLDPVSADELPGEGCSRGILRFLHRRRVIIKRGRKEGMALFETFILETCVIFGLCCVAL